MEESLEPEFYSPQCTNEHYCTLNAIYFLFYKANMPCVEKEVQPHQHRDHSHSGIRVKPQL